MPRPKSLLSLTRLVVLAAIVLSYACVTLPPPDEPLCRRILILPPNHPDELASNEIADRWIAAKKPSIGKCDRFVPREVLGSSLTFVRMTHLHNIRPRHIHAQRDLLVTRSGATHAVILNVTPRDGKATIEAEVMSLRPFALMNDENLSSPVDIPLRQLRLITPSSGRMFGLTALSLIPNSVMAWTGSGELGADPKSGYVETKRRSTLPASGVASMLYLSSALHPSEMRLFDFVPELGGSLMFTWVEEDRVFRRRCANDKLCGPNENYHISFFLISPTGGGFVSLHTPVGTTYAGTEAGIGLYSTRDTEGTDNTLPIVLTRNIVGHRVFVDDRFFIQMDVLLGRLMRPITDNRFLRVESRDYIGFSFGYYAPETKSWLRRRSM